MDKITEIQILCLNRKCVQWFNSPIFFGDMESLMSSTLIGNIAQCPHCEEMTSCNTANMRVKSTEGGFRGLDTVISETKNVSQH
ncbi:hypothetical protein [Peribacillus sp. YIM B13482]|uniref:hypothetical protein n=1 Tax=Peribacillus sp. YIM B13482 TaxID=3366298 RepID=UPI00366C5587